MNIPLCIGRPAVLALGLAVTASAVAAGLPAQDLAAPADQTLHGGGDGLDVTERDTDANGIANHMLARARELYRDLETAHRAADAHNRLDTRIALNDAARVLDALYQPTGLDALMRESQVIRDDLGDPSHAPDERLWLPLDAELTDIRDQVPDGRLAQAHRAIKQGTKASAKGDREGASQALDNLERAVGYRFALLPIRRVRDDLHAANAAMVTDPPRWQGVTVALDSALSSVHWATDLHASGWLSAYQHAADALGDLGPRPAQARRDLKAVARSLRAWPQGKSVAHQASRLATTPTLEEIQVFKLMDRIRALIPGAAVA